MRDVHLRADRFVQTILLLGGDHADHGPPGVLGCVGTLNADPRSVPLRHGRGFTHADDGASEPGLLVSRAAALRLWAGGDPIGDRVEMSDRWWTVVGVVEDVQDQTFRAAAQATGYVPSAQWPMATRKILLRTAVPPLTAWESMSM